jgi:Sap-like sulfolipid-1-addressing protein
MLGDGDTMAAGMLAQTAGLALLSAVSPTALLVTTVYLGSARPLRTTLSYLAGAAGMSTAIAVVVVFVLRGAGLSLPGHHEARFDLRLGLGLGLITIGIVIAVLLRRRRPEAAPGRRPGLVSKMIANPSTRSAFAVGLLVFAPGVTFLAALEVIATARASFELTTLAVAVAVVITVLLVWLPLVFYLIAPEPTEHRLKAFNGWLRRRGAAALAAAMIAAGVIIAATATTA